MKIRAAVLYEQGKRRPYGQSTPLVIETVDLGAAGTAIAVLGTP